MPAEEVTILGALRTFIAASPDLASSEVLAWYPDKVADQTKSLVRIELVETQPRDWLGSDSRDTSTPGKVDKAVQYLYVVRVEAWARRVNNPGGKSEQQVALEVLNAARVRLTRNKALLLEDTGLHYQDTGRVRTLEHDPNFPDWYQTTFYFSAYADEVWTEDP